MTGHDCPGPACHPYPSFGDDPARWGLRVPDPMTEADAIAAENLELWGPEGPPTWAEYQAEVAAALQDPAADLEAEPS